MAGGPKGQWGDFVSALLIGFGGALGAISRFLFGKMVAKRLPGLFPWGTLLINVGGSFCLGLLNGMAANGLVGEELRQGLGIGFLGAFTTFSTFGYESVTLLEGGFLGTGVTYIFLTLLLGLAAAWLGLASI